MPILHLYQGKGPLGILGPNGIGNWGKENPIFNTSKGRVESVLIGASHATLVEGLAGLPEDAV